MHLRNGRWQPHRGQPRLRLLARGRCGWNQECHHSQHLLRQCCRLQHRKWERYRPDSVSSVWNEPLGQHRSAMRSGEVMSPTRAAVLLTATWLLVVAQVGAAENIDPNNKGSQYAYGENIGWTN